MNIAFIFAHPDDEALSAGGTIAKYSHQENKVSTLCLTSDSTRRKEYLAATKILGVNEPQIFDFGDVVNNISAIKQNVIQYILKIRPDIVVTHIENDYHIDHRSTFTIVKESIEWAAHTTQYDDAHLVSKLYTAETTILLPNPHVLVNISDYYKQKKEAIACYHSQLHKGGQNFYIDFHKYRTKMRGVQASCSFAEAFQIIPVKRNSPFYVQKHSEL